MITHRDGIVVLADGDFLEAEFHAKSMDGRQRPRRHLRRFLHGGQARTPAGGGDFVVGRDHEFEGGDPRAHPQNIRGDRWPQGTTLQRSLFAAVIRGTQRTPPTNGGAVRNQKEEQVMQGLVLDAKLGTETGLYGLGLGEKDGQGHHRQQHLANPKLEVRDWPDPQPGPKDVLLEVQACGVCGSDMHFYETDDDDYILYPGLTNSPHPRTRVLRRGRGGGQGSDVLNRRHGHRRGDDMVRALPPLPRRLPQPVLNLEEIGFTIPGCFRRLHRRRREVLLENRCHPERFGDEEMAYELAALTEPTCVAYNAISSEPGVSGRGTIVTVFGAGPIGLAAIALAKAAGAGGCRL